MCGTGEVDIGGLNFPRVSWYDERWQVLRDHKYHRGVQEWDRSLTDLRQKNFHNHTAGFSYYATGTKFIHQRG